MVTGVAPSLPGFLLSIFIAQKGPEIPLLVDFSSIVANSRFRAFRKSICVQEKVPTSLYKYVYALEGFELTKLTYTRLEDNLIRHRGDRLYYVYPAMIPVQVLRRAHSSQELPSVRGGMSYGRRRRKLASYIRR